MADLIPLSCQPVKYFADTAISVHSRSFKHKPHYTGRFVSSGNKRNLLFCHLFAM